jgi:hypothetical protein
VSGGGGEGVKLQEISEVLTLTEVESV